MHMKEIKWVINSILSYIDLKPCTLLQTLITQVRTSDLIRTREAGGVQSEIKIKIKITSYLVFWVKPIKSSLVSFLLSLVYSPLRANHSPDLLIIVFINFM